MFVVGVAAGFGGLVAGEIHGADVSLTEGGVCAETAAETAAAGPAAGSLCLFPVKGDVCEGGKGGWLSKILKSQRYDDSCSKFHRKIN